MTACPVHIEATHFETKKGSYTVSTDPARLDARAVHAYLVEPYWARDRSYEAVVRTLHSSLCFGLYCENEQVGLARVVTDFTVYAYLCDVYVLEDHSSRGWGKWLIASVLAHPELRTVRRWMLVTRDAHEFYATQGFGPLADPSIHMELIRTPPP